MASACQGNLPLLLIRQLDLHPPGLLDGVDLDGADPALVNNLLAKRVLIENPPLTEISGSWSDDDGRPAVVRRVGQRYFAFSPTGDRAPREINERELIQYTIDLEALGRVLRADNGLNGPGPEQLSRWAILLGHHHVAGVARPVVLCRLLTISNAIDMRNQVMTTQTQPLVFDPELAPGGSVSGIVRAPDGTPQKTKVTAVMPRVIIKIQRCLRKNLNIILRTCSLTRRSICGQTKSIQPSNHRATFAAA